MYYGEVLRIALNGIGTTTHNGETPLRRHMPATTSKTSKSSGNSIEGEFVMIRTKDGATIFVGENGQFFKK